MKPSNKNKSRIPVRASPKSSQQNSSRLSKESSRLPSKVSSPIQLTPLNLNSKSEPKPGAALKRGVVNIPPPKSTLRIEPPVPVKSPTFKEENQAVPISVVLSRPPDVNQTNVADFIHHWSVSTPINILNDRLLGKIFSYVNHSDLIICCLVQKYWNRLITSDPIFLDKTVCVVTIRKQYNPILDTISYKDLTREVRNTFRHARIQNIDYKFLKDPDSFVYRNTDNELYFPNPKFLEGLVTLEFRNCFLLWHTVKRILVKSAQLESLKISNCFILDIIPPKTATISVEFEEYEGGNAIFALKSLEVYEASQLKGITTILKKFVGFKNQSLSSLKITYHPPENAKSKSDTKEDSEHFCWELKGLITLCANSLQTLILDIHHEPTLDMMGESISQLLAEVGPRMNLKEYQLTLGLGCWTEKPELKPKTNVSMKMEEEGKTPEESMEIAKSAAIAIAHFLESQKNLEELAVPCIAYPVIYSNEYKINFSKLPCADKLSFLSVPSAGFLLPEFLEQFPSLRRIKVGGSCCSDYTSGWEIFKLYMVAKQKSIIAGRGPFSLKSPQARSTKLIKKDFFQEQNSASSVCFNRSSLASSLQESETDAMKRIKELCISSCKISTNFVLLTQKLSELTLLEISSDKPIFSDDHMQACIKNLKQLRTLMIGCCDLLTDYGITGIPEDFCMTLFQLQNYQWRGINKRIWSLKNLPGRPLSDLKGLRKLVLLGNSKITDVGIGYGIEFQELKYCHMPYSDYIMAWGIQRFGEMNPSVETLVLSGVNQHSKNAFLELRKTHERMKRGDGTRSGYFVEKESPLMDDFSIVLPPPPEFLSELYATVVTKLSNFVNNVLNYTNIS